MKEEMTKIENLKNKVIKELSVMTVEAVPDISRFEVLSNLLHILLSNERR